MVRFPDNRGFGLLNVQLTYSITWSHTIRHPSIAATTPFDCKGQSTEANFKNAFEQGSFTEECGRFYLNHREHLRWCLHRMMLNLELKNKVANLMCSQPKCMKDMIEEIKRNKMSYILMQCPITYYVGELWMCYYHKSHEILLSYNKLITSTI